MCFRLSSSCIKHISVTIIREWIPLAAVVIVVRSRFLREVFTLRSFRRLVPPVVASVWYFKQSRKNTNFTVLCNKTHPTAGLNGYGTATRGDFHSSGLPKIRRRCDVVLQRAGKVINKPRPRSNRNFRTSLLGPAATVRLYTNTREIPAGLRN